MSVLGIEYLDTLPVGGRIKIAKNREADLFGQPLNYLWINKQYIKLQI